MKTRLNLIICLGACLSAGINTPAKGSDFLAARNKAIGSNRPIFIYFSMSDSSEACLRFERLVLNNPDFQSFLNSNFVFYQADLPRMHSKKYKNMPEGTKEQNRKLRNLYQINSYPTVVILGIKDDQVIQVAKLGYDGRSDIQQYIEIIKKAMADFYTKQE